MRKKGAARHSKGPIARIFGSQSEANILWSEAKIRSMIFGPKGTINRIGFGLQGFGRRESGLPEALTVIL